MTIEEPLRTTAELVDFGQKPTPKTDSEPANGSAIAGAGEPPIRIQLESKPELNEAQSSKPIIPSIKPRRRSKEERMESTQPEILDVESAAKVMGVSRWLVLRLAREGKLPGKKVGKEWRFKLKLSNLLRWVGEPEVLEIDPSTPEGIRQLLNNPRTKFRPGGYGRVTSS
ncbi:MAG: helix-turn-helix domain-containing protein [Planctomycetes bacterium]|nr:helix-turn-helix domain-containing protein [Planctomycetota bacterium]